MSIFTIEGSTPNFRYNDHNFPYFRGVDLYHQWSRCQERITLSLFHQILLNESKQCVILPIAAMEFFKKLWNGRQEWQELYCMWVFDHSTRRKSFRTTQRGIMNPIEIWFSIFLRNGPCSWILKVIFSLLFCWQLFAVGTILEVCFLSCLSSELYVFNCQSDKGSCTIKMQLRK